MSEPTDLISRSISSPQDHRLFFTRDVFAPDNATLRRALTPQDRGVSPRVLVFWDGGLESVIPDIAGMIARWFETHRDQLGLAADPIALPGGEAVKNDFRQLERIWTAIDSAGLCRHSYVMVVGGGAVLDLVGFATATAHRGIPLVRLPTTSLSQGDGGLGVKNGVNFFAKKNWLGTFSVPHAVVNDAAFLHRLPPRERRAGLIEAVKVALIRDAQFFEFIAAHVAPLAVFSPEPFEAVIRESARQHFEHIATSGDPFERGSARPLDFGHWAAHKLETISDFRLSHGEAVAIGLALDLVYARLSGLLPRQTADRILEVIAQLGFSLYTPAMELRGPDGRRRLLGGLEEFREHLGGRLTIPMIRAPGNRVDIHEMDAAQVERAIDELRSRHG